MRITNQLFINNAETVHKQLRLTVYKQCVCVLLRALDGEEGDAIGVSVFAVASQDEAVVFHSRGKVLEFDQLTIVG